MSEINDDYRNNFIRTNYRNELYLFDFKKTVISLRDVVNSLPNICRFNGHVNFFYSVADHLLNGLSFCDEYQIDNKHKILLKKHWMAHDFHEYVTGDITSPFKVVFPQISAVQKDIDSYLFDFLNISDGYDIVSSAISEIDKRILLTEMRDVQNINYTDIRYYLQGYRPYAVKINEPISIKNTRRIFKDKIEQLFEIKIERLC